MDYISRRITTTIQLVIILSYYLRPGSYIWLCLYDLTFKFQGYKPANEEPSEYQTIPLNKIEDFGVHCKQYYSLEVSYFKSSLDRRLLDSLWNKYWVNTLSSSSLITNAEYTTGQIFDLSDKLEQSEVCLGQYHFALFTSQVIIALISWVILIKICPFSVFVICIIIPSI